MTEHEDRLEELTRQSSRLELWVRLAKSPDGKLLIDDLKERMSFLRSKYKHIPVNDTHTNAILAGNQRAESEVSTLLLKLENAEMEKKLIDMEASEVIEYINKKDALPRQNRFVSEEAVQRSKDARA